MNNLGNALLILGCLYFGYTYGFAWWLIILIVFAFGMWSYAGFSNERRKKYNAEIDLLKVKTEFIRKKMEATK